MDALPVTEVTGLPYASKVKTRDKYDNEVGVMHACGHDIHMTVWVGTARVLADMKDQWQGTLVFIAQPAEEIGGGAKAMLKDGLFEKFPKPDYALALHCDGSRPFGTVAYTDGLAMANVDSVDILVKGKGGHGSAPHTTVDPDRVVGTHYPRSSNPGQPGNQSNRPGRRHGRFDSRRHQAQHHPKRVQNAADGADDEGFRAQGHPRRHQADREGGGGGGTGAGARSHRPPGRVHAGAGEQHQADGKDGDTVQGSAGRGQGAGTAADHGLARISGRYGRDGGVPIFLYFLGTVPAEKVKLAEADSTVAAVAALGSVLSGAGAEHPHGGADDEHGGANVTLVGK